MKMIAIEWQRIRDLPVCFARTIKGEGKGIAIQDQTEEANPICV